MADAKYKNSEDVLINIVDDAVNANSDTQARSAF